MIIGVLLVALGVAQALRGPLGRLGVSAAAVPYLSLDFPDPGSLPSAATVGAPLRVPFEIKTTSASTVVRWRVTATGGGVASGQTVVAAGHDAKVTASLRAPSVPGPATVLVALVGHQNIGLEFHLGVDHVRPGNKR